MIRLPSPRELEIRTENRYILRPQNKKRCTKCETVFSGISENFDIHHVTAAGNYSYAGQCKQCLTLIRAKRTEQYKTNISLYVKRLIPAVRCRAKENNLKFNLTQPYLVNLWNKQEGKCFYTNKPLNLRASTKDKKSPHIHFPSLDKLKPARGYVRGNVVWTSYGVNRMKNEFSKDEFIHFCKIVAGKFK